MWGWELVRGVQRLGDKEWASKDAGLLMGGRVLAGRWG